MKESMYNIYFLDEKSKKCIVFNTMYRSAVQIDDEVYSLIKTGNISKIQEESLEELINERIVVEDNLDESKMLKIKFGRGKFNTRVAGFTIIPTHACNLACKYCYQGHGDILRNTMNEEIIQKTFAFITKKAEGFKRLSLTLYGGEPLLFPDITFKILEKVNEFVKKNNMEFLCKMATNGTLLTEEIAETLNKYDCNVQLTLAGAKDLHNKRRIDKKGNGTYDSVVETISLLKERGTKFHVRVDVDEDNCGSIDVLLDDLKERELGGIFIVFSSIERDTCYTKMEYDASKAGLASLAHLSKMAYDKGFKTNPIHIYNFVQGCGALQDNFFTIDPKGDVYKCYAAPYYSEHRLGTINDEGELTHINYDAYCKWTLRDPLSIEECQTCKFAPICGGGCAMAAYKRNGDINFPGCEKRDMGEIIRMYILQKCPELFEECTYETIVV
jgi:uncharacterized protein